jgi:hypothetical protein
MQAALDALGVRIPTRFVPEKREQPPVDPWWKRGEECPF